MMMITMFVVNKPQKLVGQNLVTVCLSSFELSRLAGRVRLTDSGYVDLSRRRAVRVSPNRRYQQASSAMTIKSLNSIALISRSLRKQKAREFDKDVEADDKANEMRQK